MRKRDDNNRLIEFDGNFKMKQSVLLTLNPPEVFFKLTNNNLFHLLLDMNVIESAYDCETWRHERENEEGKHLSDYPMVLENDGERLAEEIYQTIVEMIEELEIDIASFLAEEIREKVDEINEKAVASLEPEEQKNIDHEGFPSLKDK